MSEEEKLKDDFRKYAIQKYIASKRLLKSNPIHDRKMRLSFQEMSITDVRNASKSLAAQELLQEKLDEHQAEQVADKALELFKKKLKGLKI